MERDTKIMLVIFLVLVAGTILIFVEGSLSVTGHVASSIGIKAEQTVPPPHHKLSMAGFIASSIFIFIILGIILVKLYRWYKN